MTCEFCGGQTTKKLVTKTHWFRGRLYIIEAVEAEVCRECGERYFHARTLDAIDRALDGGGAVVKQQIQVQIVGIPA